MSLITCRNVALGYEGNVVVSGLDFEVNRGDYLCIVGENGAGKSTLMKTILGLRKPISGSIEMGEGLKNTDIGYLPQQTVVQKDFPASVREIVFSGCVGKKGFHPFYSREDRMRATHSMERMGILDLSKRCYRELSGGQQQRVLLARALCATEEILLLDEPVSGLDPKVTSQMYELIKELNKSGITIIMISHDIRAAVEYASHILQISSTAPFFGPTSEYLSSETCMLGGVSHE